MEIMYITNMIPQSKKESTIIISTKNNDFIVMLYLVSDRK